MKLSTRVSNPAVPLCASMVRLSTGLPWMQRTMASSVMESGPQGNALTSTMPSTRWCSCVMAPMISRFTIHGSVSEKSKLACSERSRSASSANSTTAFMLSSRSVSAPPMNASCAR